MRTRLFAAFCVAVMVASCGSGDDDLPMVRLTEADSGQTVALRVGQGVTVTLEANASTGYSWAFECSPADVVTAVGEAAYVPDEPVAPGSGGRMQYEFTTSRPGTATARFEYRRAWEAGVPAAKTVTYSLVVR